MEVGKRHSPIVNAIAEAEKHTTGQIRVHLTKRWIEPDPMRRAVKLFHHFELAQHPRQAVLIYVNLRRRKFAVIGDDAVNKVAGQTFWNSLSRELAHHLTATHPEKAIAEIVRSVGKMLEKHFPKA